MLQLESPAEIFIAGDIHGNRANLAKVLDAADLPHHSDRVLVLQEIVHGPLDPKTHADRKV